MPISSKFGLSWALWLARCITINYPLAIVLLSVSPEFTLSLEPDAAVKTTTGDYYLIRVTWKVLVESMGRAHHYHQTREKQRQKLKQHLCFTHPHFPRLKYVSHTPSSLTPLPLPCSLRQWRIGPYGWFLTILFCCSFLLTFPLLQRGSSAWAAVLQ